MNRTVLTMFFLSLLVTCCDDRSVDLVDLEKDATLSDALPDTTTDKLEATEATTGACTVESNCATGATFCCAWRGDVYLWNSALGCRRKVHSLTDAAPYECLDTGTPATEPGACQGYSVQTCYARNRGDEGLEVLMSSYEWPTQYLTESEWHLCSDELEAAVTNAQEY